MIKSIIDVLCSSKHILLVTHENPDGDAIGSLVGMAYICQFFHKPYTILLESIPDQYSFLVKGLEVQNHFSAEYDLFISLDCGDVKRFSVFERYFNNAKYTINIDHHATNDQFAYYNYVEKDASSTSEMIFDIVNQSNISLTIPLAQALFTGILTDTGGFMHPCTHPSTHRAVAKLLETGFDFNKIYYEMIHQKTEHTVLLQSVAVQRMIKLCNGKVFLSYINEEDLQTYQSTREEASGIVSYLKNIKGCEIAVFLYPSNTPNAYKVSFRSNAPYDVAELADTFNGGGHVRAAGATIQGEIQEIIEKIKANLTI